MASFHTDLYKLLEPLPDTEGCWGWFDDTRTCLYVPCEPRPKGSATPLPRKRKDGTPYIQWIGGSDSKGAGLLKEQERITRQAVAALWARGFTPYDDAVTLDAVMVMKQTKSAQRKENHTQYPDRDKLLRAVQDCLSPITANRKRQLDKPHIVLDDALIDDGRTTKMWLPTWNKVAHADDDSEGIYMVLYPTCFDPF